MTPEEIVEVFKAPAGYLGPIGAEAAPHPKKPGTLVILDKALEGRANLIAGANQEEYHLRNVTPARDFKVTLIADVRSVIEGEGDPIDGSPLRIGKAVEIGHIFKLGYKYAKSMGATVLNRDGKEVMPIMGSYGIGIERILTAAIESSAAANDGTAFALHPAIAPFQVVVTITNSADAALQAARRRGRCGTHRQLASMFCWTTATNAPGSSRATPISSEFPIESTSDGGGGGRLSSSTA